MKKQSKGFKGAGSLVNVLRGNNATEPVVGAGATEMHYSDRSAYEVLSVSKDGNGCSIQRYATKLINKDGIYGAQQYEYKELTGSPIELRWRYGKWRSIGTQIVFTDAFAELHGFGCA